MARFTIEIDVYSDLVCPWCYLGKEALDKAIATYTAQHPEADFKLNWKPYLLWPKVGVSAYERGAALQAIYGPSTPIVLERLAKYGAQYGIDFKWEGRSGNSRDAHKLVLLAMERDAAASSSLSSPTAPDHDEPTTITPSYPSPTITITSPDNTPASPKQTTPPPSPPPHTQTTQHRTLTHLFTSAFQHGADLSSRSFLARTAVELGLLPTESDALSYLSHPEPTKQVDTSSAAARVMAGVSAVPSYVVQGRWLVGGWQGEEVWVGVFERVRRAFFGDGSDNGSGGVRYGTNGLTRIGRGNGVEDGDGEGRLRLELWVEEQRREGGTADAVEDT